MLKSDRPAGTISPGTIPEGILLEGDLSLEEILTETVPEVLQQSGSFPAEVVTIGEEMVLFWPATDESLETATLFERSFGGAEGNFAIALSRLGCSVRWISKLGNDPFGRYIHRSLRAEGVLVDAAIDPVAPTAVFFKEKVRTGPRRVVYYRRGSAASRLLPTDLTAGMFAGARLLHLTGITPALSESCAETLERAIDLARAAGCLVSFDPNVRMQLWPDAATCREHLLRLLARADLALLGDEDAAVLFPGLEIHEVTRAVRALGPTTVVLKMGADGAIAQTADQLIAVPAYRVTVVDTVGAGDGFNAGFVAGLLRGHDIQDCLRLGARVGAAAVAAAGDWEGYPRVTSLDQLLEDER